MRMSRRTVAIVLFAAIGAATPLVAHAVGGSCWIYLPAHVPALLAGLTMGTVAGGVTGAATVVSDVLWGGRVHGIAFLPLGVEFMTYGLVAGAASRRGDRYLRRLLTLIIAMLAGRLAYLIGSTILGRELAHALRGLFVAPWPGILFQLSVLPLIAPWVRRVTESARTVSVAKESRDGL